MAGRKKTELQRFFEKVELTNDGCWEWKAGYKSRYPRFKKTGARQSMLGHRYAYQTFVGDIPPNHFVCHRCDNNKCVNPFHLKACTHEENMDEMVLRGRNQIDFLESKERRSWFNWLFRR